MTCVAGNCTYSGTGASPSNTGVKFIVNGPCGNTDLGITPLTSCPNPDPDQYLCGRCPKLGDGHTTGRYQFCSPLRSVWVVIPTGSEPAPSPHAEHEPQPRQRVAIAASCLADTQHVAEWRRG